MDLRTHNHDYILEFINCFRDNPCLWKTTLKEYKNKACKLTSYTKLLEISKKYNVNATIDQVKKQLQSLRASHRKERKKVAASKGTGTGKEDVYRPKLWYYTELEFLNDQVEGSTSMSTLDTDLGNDDAGSESSTQQSDEISNEPASVRSQPDSLPSQALTRPATETPTFTRKRKDDNSNQIFNLISQRLNQKEDEFDVIGRHIAVKLRTVTTRQKIIAEKLINDVLFHAQLEQLSLASQIKVQSEPISTNVPHYPNSATYSSNTTYPNNNSYSSTGLTLTSIGNNPPNIGIPSTPFRNYTSISAPVNTPTTPMTPSCSAQLYYSTFSPE